MGLDQQQSTSDSDKDEICTEVSRIIYDFMRESHEDDTIEDLRFKLKVQKIVSSGNFNKFVKALRGHITGKLIDIFVEQLVQKYTTEEQRKDFIREACKIVLYPFSMVKAAEKFSEILNEKYVEEEYNNTSIHLAAEQGNLNAVKYFVEKEGNINAQDENGYTPLHLAAKQGNLDIVKYLIEKGADIDAYQGGWSYSTVLHLAAENGHLDVVKYLIEKGANPKSTDSDSKTPMQRANENGHSDIVKYLRERVHQVTEEPQITERQRTTEKLEILNEDGDTALNIAAVKDDLNAVKYLIEKGADVDVRNKYGATPLHAAAIRGNVEIAKYLLDHGADVNAQVVNGLTPLNWATLSDHLTMVKLLLDYCADVNIKEGESDAGYNYGYGRTPLISAIVACNIEIAKLLLDNGADVSIKGRGLTALDFAEAKKDKCPEILTLLKDSNIKNTDSRRSHCTFTLTASNAVKPSSFINGMFNWVSTSSTAAISGIFQGTSLPSAQQPITYSSKNLIDSSPIGFGEMAFLADVAVRKFSGQKYSRPLDDSLLTLDQIRERKLSAVEGNVKKAIGMFGKLDL